MTKILIIEDNSEIKENTAEILMLEGYEVELAENGNEGVNLAKDTLPDVILCDIIIPELNGWQVLDTLKKDDVTAAIPFIFLTASGDKKEMQTAITAGAAQYIRKPYDPHDLLVVIHDCLKRN